MKESINLPIENKEELNKDYFLKEIDSLLNKNSEEIPDEMLHSFSTNNDYKIRTAWFHSIAQLVDYAIKLKYIPDDFKNTIVKPFLDDYKQRREIEGEKHRTTKEDIEKGNEILRKAKEYLETNKQ